jgi:hypothetical protein
MVIIVAQVAVAYVNLYTIAFLPNMDLADFLEDVLLTASL